MAMSQFNLPDLDFSGTIDELKKLREEFKLLKKIPAQYHKHFSGLYKQGLSISETYELLKETFKF